MKIHPSTVSIMTRPTETNRLLAFSYWQSTPEGLADGGRYAVEGINGNEIYTPEGSFWIVTKAELKKCDCLEVSDFKSVFHFGENRSGNLVEWFLMHPDKTRDDDDARQDSRKA